MLDIDLKDDVITSTQLQRDFGKIVQAVASGHWKYITSGETTIALVPFDELRAMLRAKEELDALRLVTIADEAQKRAERGEARDIDEVLARLNTDYLSRYEEETPELTEISIAAYLDL